MTLIRNFRESLPQQRWFSILFRALRHVRDRDVMLIVYGLSFVTLLSFVPFLIITLGLFKTTGFLKFLYPKIEALVVKNFSGVVSVEISRHLHSLLKRSYSGSWGFFNVTFLLFTTTRLAAFLEKAMNRIWNVKNPKNFLRRFATHWVVIMMVPLALAMNVLARSFVNQWVKSPLILLTLSFSLLAATLFALYKWLPNHQVRSTLAMGSGFLAAFSLLTVHRFFDYASNLMFNYSKFYGSLAVLPLFMIWISTVWLVILLGASICAGIQKALEHKDDC
jgi:membrane protein